jgi:hypothetical protein
LIQLLQYSLALLQAVVPLLSPPSQHQLSGVAAAAAAAAIEQQLACVLHAAHHVPSGHDAVLQLGLALVQLCSTMLCDASGADVAASLQAHAAEFAADAWASWPEVVAQTGPLQHLAAAAAHLHALR